MIICSCNAIREDDIRAAGRRGAPCPLTAYRSLGKEPQCGTCLPAAREIIDEERGAMLSTDSVAA